MLFPYGGWTCEWPTKKFHGLTRDFILRRIFAIIAEMSENEDRKVEEFRERELEEFRKRYLAANPPIDWPDFLMTIPPGTSRGNIQLIYRQKEKRGQIFG